MEVAAKENKPVKPVKEHWKSGIRSKFLRAALQKKCQTPRGYFQIRRSGGAWTSHQVWRQNLGQDPAKFTKSGEKFGKFCHHKTQKLGKSPNFGVISEIQRAKFWGICHLYFWRQNLGLQQEFQRQILGPSPPDLQIWKYPRGSNPGRVGLHELLMEIEKVGNVEEGDRCKPTLLAGYSFSCMKAEQLEEQACEESGKFELRNCVIIKFELNANTSQSGLIECTLGDHEEILSQSSRRPSGTAVFKKVATFNIDFASHDGTANFLMVGTFRGQ